MRDEKTTEPEEVKKKRNEKYIAKGKKTIKVSHITRDYRFSIIIIIIKDYRGQKNVERNCEMIGGARILCFQWNIHRRDHEHCIPIQKNWN